MLPAAVHGKIMEQVKDVDSLKPQEISVYWVGMAEVNILTRYPFSSYKSADVCFHIRMCKLWAHLTGGPKGRQCPWSIQVTMEDSLQL